MIPRELSLTAARLFAWHPGPDNRRPEDVPLDPGASLWYLRIPQSAAALLENWDDAIRIVTGLRWISRPYLTTDDAGCPELQLEIAPSERRAVLRCASLIRGDLGLVIFTDAEVSRWQAATRGVGVPDRRTRGVR